MEVTQELIERFKEICAVNDDKARQFLEHCNGELETAVHLFLQTNGVLGMPGPSMNASVENEIRRRNIQPNFNQNMHRAVIQRREPVSWLEWFIAVAAIPVRFTISIIWNIFSIFTGNFLESSSPKVTDPRGDVLKFVSEYEHNYRDQLQPLPFSRSTYDEVVNEAKRTLRVLLVYIHDSGNTNSSNFIQNVLHSEQFNNLISDKNLLLWGVSLQSGQGAYLAQALRPTGYPYVALLSLKNNKMTMIIQMSANRIDADFVCDNLRIAIEHHESQLNILRQQKAQREEDQRIRAEQEREYRESAAKDRARIQERKRLESERADAEERERQKQREAEERKDVIASRRSDMKAVLEEEPSGSEIVRVQVRFPCGARLDRRFNVDDNLEKLFNATFVHESCPDFFSAHTSYPRKELLCAPEWYHKIRSTHLSAAGESATEFILPKTFKEEGLEKSLVVMIHDCEA